MTLSSLFLCPAYYLEAKGFNPAAQPSNSVAKELAARIIALAAPILYLYQVMLHGIVSAIDLTLCLITVSPGIILQSTIPVFCSSTLGTISSLLEIPEKLYFGPHCQPNYLKVSDRYKQIDFLSNVGRNLI